LGEDQDLSTVELIRHNSAEEAEADERDNAKETDIADRKGGMRQVIEVPEDRPSLKLAANV
jgi:hypothetical protein